MGVHIDLARYEGKKRIGSLPEWDWTRFAGDGDFFARLREYGQCDVLWTSEIDSVFRPNFFPMTDRTRSILIWAEAEIGVNMDRWELALRLLKEHPDAWVEVSY